MSRKTDAVRALKELVWLHDVLFDFINYNNLQKDFWKYHNDRIEKRKEEE